MGSILSVIATLFWGVLAGTIITGLVIYLMSELIGTLRVAIGALGGVLVCFGVAALPGLTGNGRSRQGRRGSPSVSHRRVAHSRRPQRR